MKSGTYPLAEVLPRRQGPPVRGTVAIVSNAAGFRERLRRYSPALLSSAVGISIVTYVRWDRYDTPWWLMASVALVTVVVLSALVVGRGRVDQSAVRLETIFRIYGQAVLPDIRENLIAAGWPPLPAESRLGPHGLELWFHPKKGIEARVTKMRETEPIYRTFLPDTAELNFVVRPNGSVASCQLILRGDEIFHSNGLGQLPVAAKLQS